MLSSGRECFVRRARRRRRRLVRGTTPPAAQQQHAHGRRFVRQGGIVEATAFVVHALLAGMFGARCVGCHVHVLKPLTLFMMSAECEHDGLRFGNASGLVDALCSGECAAGFFCKAGATAVNEMACGGTSVYCPPGSGAPVPVSLGYYSVPADGAVAVRSGQQQCEPGSFCSDGVALNCGSAAVWCGAGATSPTPVDAGYYSLPVDGDSARRSSQAECEAGESGYICITVYGCVLLCMVVCM